MQLEWYSSEAFQRRRSHESKPDAREELIRLSFPNELRFFQPLHHHPHPPLRPQRGEHFAPARCASGLAHDAQRRQCSGCSRGSGSGDHDLRASEQWLGFGLVLHFVGWQKIAWLERLGPRAQGVDCGLLPQQIRPRQRAAEARNGQRDCAGRGGQLGGAEREVWQTALCRPDGASH